MKLNKYIIAILFLIAFINSPVNAGNNPDPVKPPNLFKEYTFSLYQKLNDPDLKIDALEMAISGFEISLKHHKGKLVLPVDPEEWFKQITKHHDLRIIPLDLIICIRSTTLPAIHMDPCDRFIIATAEIHKLPVVTADRIFPQYGITVMK